MRAPRLAQLRSDAQSRIQSGGRALRNQADQPSTNRAELRFPERHQVLAQESRSPANPRAGVVQQPKDRERQSAFPRSTLAHQSDNLAWQDLDTGTLEHAGLLRVINRKDG